MFCSRCGKKLRDDAAFCDSCGTPIPNNQTSGIPQKSSKVPIGGTNVTSLLKRAYLCLEDEEWDTAIKIFNYILSTLDFECANAYLGTMLAHQHCANLDELVHMLLEKTADPEMETCSACEKNKIRIEQAAELYVVDGYLSKQNIHDIFAYKLTYQSAVKSRKDQQQKMCEFWRQDKSIKRIYRFADEDLKRQMDLARSKIFAEMEHRISVAEQEAKDSIQQIQSGYSAYLDQAEEKVKVLHNRAIEQREADYQDACILMETAQSREEYEEAGDKFNLLLDYKDSQKRRDVCYQESSSKESNLVTKQNTPHKPASRIIPVIGVAVVVVVALLIFLIWQATKNPIQEPIPPATETISPHPTPTPIPTPSPTPEPVYDINGNPVPNNDPSYYSNEWVAVDAYNLYNEWNDNPVRAQMNYDAHWVRVCYPSVTSISEDQIYVNDTLVYGCTITFHIDDIDEAVKTNKGEYPVIAGYFVVEEGTKNFHVYHSKVLDSVDYETWSQKRYPNGMFGELGDVTVGWSTNKDEGDPETTYSETFSTATTVEDVYPFSLFDINLNLSEKLDGQRIHLIDNYNDQRIRNVVRTIVPTNRGDFYINIEFSNYDDALTASNMDGYGAYGIWDSDTASLLEATLD